jgi:aspartyl-tRNA(Asn)/glutamyl-tRNA(Gln) amidotransferase subunit A
MITLKEALSLSKDEIKEIKQDINKKAKENKKLGAYIEQFSGSDLSDNGDGVPIAIKDVIAIKNQELSCCSKILQGYKSPFNASIIDNLNKNNMSAFGRTNMDEFAMGSSTETSVYGKTLNPFNDNCVPGGSSGGSASAVGGGIAIAALGSDTGGSVRQPAAFCGCVGMKPTYGRVSRYGLVAYSSSLDQIGPITQNVEDSSILYDAIAGYDNKDSTSSNHKIIKTSQNLNPNRKLKIAIIDNYLESASKEVSSAILDLVKELEKQGHSIIHKNMIDTKCHLSAYYTLASCEASTNLSKFDGIRFGNRAKGESLKDIYKNTRTQGFGEEVKRRILTGTFALSSGYYEAYYIKAQKVRHIIKQEYDNIFKEADIILTPTTPDVAFEFGSKKGGLDMYLEDIYTISINLVGLPAMSVPIAKKNNLPFSVQIISDVFCEQEMFDMGLMIEKTVNFSK